MEWKTRLTKDQAEAAVRSRYYAYRGDAGTDEESEIREMNDLFPDFDGENSESEESGASYDARAVAVKLAKLHQKLYLVKEPQLLLHDYVLHAVEILSNTRDTNGERLDASFTDLLPAILLQVEAKVAEVNGTERPQNLNIYADSDVVESRKLFHLVHQIQTRFRQIAEQWPEHAVPVEALSFCREVLYLSIGDPIAKLLTKTEKLYEIVSQWQSVASREWSVSPLLEQLSALVVGWRRLELLSWSRLLDEEGRRHEEDAQAWYFIAYESVLYNSTRILDDGEDVRRHCGELTRTLEEFLKTTTLGQYSSRLELLDTLGRTLSDLAEREPQLRPVRDSVRNICQHYRRYEPAIQTSLQTGRATLEKALKEQILLASWKDTNVIALRDSARRSHHKLFRIVRKYRSLLNQVVATFTTSNTLASSTPAERTVSDLAELQIEQDTIATACEECSRVIADWHLRPDRLINPLGAVKSMRRLYTRDAAADLGVHLELAAFREDLCEGIKELRAQTPSTLTEENGAVVRHLQERKRRLLADTLKSVMQMGVRRNLPTLDLAKQSSTATILASSPDPPTEGLHAVSLRHAGDSFHELLDAMLRVRAGRAEHSEDLTEGEVGRSIGLLEGLLSVTLDQRQSIVWSATELTSLQVYLSLLGSVLKYPTEELSLSSTPADDHQQTSRLLAWLAELLILASRVLKFQAQYAGFDVDELVDSMRSYSDKLKEVRTGLDELPALPSGLECEAAQSLKDRSLETLSELGSFLRHWQTKEPRVDFVLRQIVPWAEKSAAAAAMAPQDGKVNGVNHVSLGEFDDSLRTLVDQVFVALQKLASVQKDLPQSTEDAGWFSKSDKIVAQAIRSMQASTIGTGLKSVLDKIHCLTREDFPAARNLLLVASPVIEQYHDICRHLHSQQNAIHLETCRLALQLSTSFSAILSQGFCRPSKTEDGEEQSGQLERGTGLGEGEGAEDISKDVGDDEDLSELAQSGQKEEQDNDVENVDDAVDMGNDDLEGEMGDYDEQKTDDDRDGDRSEDEEGDDIDEETGSVDELDPTAIDEKMWNDMKNESEKDKELKNDEAKGKKSDDQTEADGEKAEGEDTEGLEGEQEEMDEDNADEGEGAERPEAENMDPHPDDQDALELPEELQLAGQEETQEDEISDDGMDGLSDIDKGPDEEADVDEPGREEKSEGDMDQKEEPAEEEDELENGTAQEDEIMEDQPDEPEEDETGDHDTRQDDMVHDLDEQAGGESGAANELQDTVDPDQNTQGMNQADQEPNPQQSRPGQAPENQEQGDTGQGATEMGAGRRDEVENEQHDEALKKLADVLEQYHQRREILPASKEPEQQHTQQDDVDMADVDFEHLPDDDMQEDAQALGAAGDNQAQNLDQSKAIEDDHKPLDEATDVPDPMEPEMPENIAERFSRLQQAQAEKKARDGEVSGAFVPEREERPSRPQDGDDADEIDTATDEADERDADEPDLALDIEQLDIAAADGGAGLLSATDAAQLWHQCSTRTHQLSLVLTEQLRLILSPTTATKLRGDFRTGKRLNIKRVIPYIASGYKRDKIWMRRSVPSKRSYQVMVAVDDSRSMSESGADLLGFETLAMLTRSLAMLEVGEICVVGFADKVHVAHPFGVPFSVSSSGPDVFRSFTFGQSGTDVRHLLSESIHLFQQARLASFAADDLWQLQLIVSDGHCSDHAGISRLVRQAQAEKIVVVFVIVDAGPESILDLKEAVFEPDPTAASGGGGAGEMRVRTKRYLEDFPFPYYLVVRDVRDLPGVLATALKGWFGSVVDVQG
jgi:midasin